MNALLQVWRRFVALFRSRQWEEDMAEEMRLHLEQRTEDNIAAGMSAAEARFAAQREFGGIEQIKETAREQRGWLWLEHIVQDLRYGGRILRKQPGFTVVAVLTMALGIGATTAIFSVVNGVLLHPLAYPRGDRLAMLAEVSPKIPQGGITPGAFSAWSQQARSFERVAAWKYGPYNLTGAGDPRRVFAQQVTAGYFGILGLSPELGRDFRADEDTPEKDQVVILSHALWQDQFGGRTSVIGQTVLLDERRFVVIGVMPDDFIFERRADLYTPCVISEMDRQNFAERNLLMLGRLKPGVSTQQAREEMTGLSKALTRQLPDANMDWSLILMPLLDATVRGVRPLLLALLGAVGCLLLIACVNVANLVLARGTSRQREIAVRVALGAGRGRIVRQLLCESLLIAGLGGALGVLLGYGGMHLLLAFMPEGLPRVKEVAMDHHVLGFACALSLCTGIGFGLVPALEATAVDAVETLKDSGHGISEGRRRRRLRSTLVVVEVALALILLAGAGLLARSFVRLQHVNSGFTTRDLFMSNIMLAPQKFPTAARRTDFVEQAIARIGSVPGVEAVAFTNHTLPTMGMGRTFFHIAGQSIEPMQLPPAFYYAVTPDYFRILGIPLLRGRSFTAADAAGAPRVALINEYMVGLYFPATDPIGQQISVGNGPDTWREIVGIVGNVKQNGPNQPTSAQIYEPFAQSPSISTSFVVKSRLDAPPLGVAVGAAIHSLDKDIPLTTVYALSGSKERTMAVMRFQMLLFAVFAAGALFLSAIGVYGVMTYTVSQRTGEIGIRMALGAQRSDVLWMILRQGACMVGLGLLLGLAGSLALSRLVAWMLFEVSPYDPPTLAGIMALLAGVALFACWLPARRATKVDPLIALRCE